MLSLQYGVTVSPGVQGMQGIGLSNQSACFIGYLRAVDWSGSCDLTFGTQMPRTITT